MCVRASACIAVACSCFSHAFQCVVREREGCVYKVKKKMREGALRQHCCTPLWVVAFHFFFLFLYSCLQWPLCTALTWHGDRHCVPLSPLQTEKKKKKITQRFAGFVCQWRSPRLFWYTLRWEVRRRVMSDACACSRHPLVSGAVGLPARRQVAPAQHACVLPCLFSMNPRPDFPRPSPSATAAAAAAT